MEENETTQQKPQIQQPEILLKNDVLSLYIYLRSQIFTGEREYNRIISLIYLGISLFSNIKQEKLDANGKEEIKKIIAEVDTLDSEYVPSNPDISVTSINIDGKQRIKIMKISSKDGGESQHEPEYHNDSYNNFRNQQFFTYTTKLNKIDSQILNILTKYGVVHGVNPSVDELIDEMIKGTFKNTKVGELCPTASKDTTVANGKKQR